MGIRPQNGPQEGPSDPLGMDPKVGPKIRPGRILIKPETVMRDMEYIGARGGQSLTSLGKP